MITGNPEKKVPRNANSKILRRSFETTCSKRPNDFNGPKVTLRELSIENNKLNITAGLTDYFTLWGLPQTSLDLHQTTTKEIVLQRKTENPLGISIHNILITKNGKAVVRVSSPTGGFSAGRTSVTHEEQMDPNSDINPFNTSLRGFYEEQGLIIPTGQTKLLGIAKELGSAYVCFCFLGLTNKSDDEIMDSWKRVPDYSETNSMRIISIDKALGLPKEKGVNLHPTVLWRLKLLEKHISIL